ncbi:hypothetical protein D3C80_1164940 [compost metagenome]
MFCSTVPAWLPITLLATSCTRMTKLLLPVSLSAAALEALKVKRTSPPSSPRVPPSAAKLPTVMVPTKLPVSAPLPATLVISRYPWPPLNAGSRRRPGGIRSSRRRVWVVPSGRVTTMS